LARERGNKISVRALCNQKSCAPFGITGHGFVEICLFDGVGTSDAQPLGIKKAAAFAAAE